MRTLSLMEGGGTVKGKIVMGTGEAKRSKTKVKVLMRKINQIQ